MLATQNTFRYYSIVKKNVQQENICYANHGILLFVLLFGGVTLYCQLIQIDSM